MNEGLDPDVIACHAGSPYYTGSITVKKSEYEEHKKYWDAEIHRRTINGLIGGIQHNLDELKKYLSKLSPPQ